MNNLSFEDLKNEIKLKKGLIFLLVTTEQCKPCREMTSVIKGLENHFQKDGVRFFSIDLERNPSLATYFTIEKLPAAILLYEGIIRGTHPGLQTKKEYIRIIEEILRPEEKTDIGKADSNHTVKVFSTPTCPYCTMVKEYLKEKMVAFEEVNVAEDQKQAEKMVVKSGEMGVPQLWIDDQVVVGFNKPEIDRLLGL